MSLDITKLENLQELPDKITARCPACAEEGHDNKGNHLVIYPNQKYGCVANQGDSKHNRRIWTLAGQKTGRGEDKSRVERKGKNTGDIRFPVTPHPALQKWKDDIQKMSK